MVFKMEEAYRASPLFRGWQETLIWSCLQGIMGNVYADSPDKPASAMACLGDFRFFAGKPSRDLVLYWPDMEGMPDGGQGWCIMVPRDAGWTALIEGCYRKNARKVVRYATKKEPDVFNREKLQAALGLVPDGYGLRQMDEALFGLCREIVWCRDWVSQYRDFTMYQKYGMGTVMLKDGVPVSGASSYAGYHGGIEIQIDTVKGCRGRGLAYICGAKLILDCLQKGIYPSWDAQNKGSLRLAERLGYRFAGVYEAFEVEVGVAR